MISAGLRLYFKTDKQEKVWEQPGYGHSLKQIKSDTEDRLARVAAWTAVDGNERVLAAKVCLTSWWTANP